MVKQRIDLNGQRYGRLIVIAEVEPAGYMRRWKCRCDCGNELIVRMSNLRTGHTTSCGCVQAERASQSNIDDLSGQAFGRLTVVGRADPAGKSRHAFWICRCECGKTLDVNGVRLRSGETTSCGCRRTDAGSELQTYNNENLYNDGVFTPVLQSKIRSDNASGIKGVSEERRKDGSIVYKASIRVKGVDYYLGRHATKEAATAARKAGEEKYHKPYLEDRNG